ncbi:MAG: hypothetical protein CVU56_08245 [Deltaproteobacteria bacterium HGW-Deltaproteobacteria-14]|nr:MAG: hypothetical protein CVU56_08245 [Deltaproteobacteria bacterium HGW-Deltaproteobacteria-14]
MERLLVMRRNPVFTGLPPQDLEVLSQLGRESVFRRGELLQHQDEPILTTHLIVEGVVEVMRDGVVGERVEAEGGVGGPDFFAQRRLGLRATALTEVVALSFSTDVLLEVLEDQFSIVRRLFRMTTKAFIEMMRRLPGDRDMPDLRARPPCRHLGRPLDLVERLVFLRRMPGFTESSVDTMTEIAKAFEEVRLPAGHTLWREGEASSRIICVVDGLVRETAAGRPGVVRNHPYAMMGAATSFAEQPHFMTATTVTPVVALVIDLGRLLDVLEDNFEMSMALLGLLMRRVFALRRTARGLEASA